MATSIGLLGDFDESKASHRELKAAVGLFPDGIEARWIGTDDPEARRLDRIDGLWVFPGSPYRDDEAVFDAIEWALAAEVPFLATCSGFQYTLVVLARRAGIADPGHAEIDPGAERPLIAPLACDLDGKEREIRPVPGSRLAAILGPDPFPGMHWCGYGLDASYLPDLLAAGVSVSANAEDAGTEAVEVRSHPFFHATLFQPQVGSLAGRPLSPLIGEFLRAAEASPPEPS